MEFKLGNLLPPPHKCTRNAPQQGLSSDAHKLTATIHPKQCSFIDKYALKFKNRLGLLVRHRNGPFSLTFRYS